MIGSNALCRRFLSTKRKEACGDARSKADARSRIGRVALLASIAGASIVLTPTAASAQTTATSSTWTSLNPNPTATNTPSGRDGAAMAYDPATNQVVLFGGYTGNGYGQSTWVWNGSSWTQVNTPTNQTPGNRGYAMMAYDATSRQLVLFGGQNQPGCDAAGFLNDTWVWNGSGWTHETPASSPSVRAFASMAYDPANGGLILFGGQSATGNCTAGTAVNDSGTWLWQNNTWTRLLTTGPSARYGTTMTYDSATSDLVLFGGTSSSYGAGPGLSDTWLWNGTAWSQSAATGPSERFGAAMHYDPAIGEPVLFGGSGAAQGTNSTTPTGTWTFTGSAWTRQTPSNTPQARFAPSIAYDSAQNQLLMFGGQSPMTGAQLQGTYSYELTTTSTTPPPATAAPPPTTAPPATTPPAPRAPASTAPGYWEVASDGGIFSFGNAAFYGSMGGTRLNAPVVGMAADPATGGYWEVASDGGVFSFHAPFYGSMGATKLNQPVVAMAATPDGKGYWLVAADGGVFSFGDAAFYGSAGASPPSQPVDGIAATPSGHGYWLLTRGGTVLRFGDAGSYSVASGPISTPTVALAATPDGQGFWLASSNGSVATAGDARSYGSASSYNLYKPVVSMAATQDGKGYWETAGDGGVFSFGDAAYLGSMGGKPLNAPVVGMAAT